MKKKFLSLMMAAAVVATTSVSAFADTTIDGVTYPDTFNVDGLDDTDARANVNITGSVTDEEGNMPATSFKVTVPTAASFTVNQTGFIGTDLEIKNEGSQEIEVYAQSFSRAAGGTGTINLVKESDLTTQSSKTRADVALRLEGQGENKAYLNAGVNGSGVYEAPELVTPAKKGVKLLSLPAGDKKAQKAKISLRGSAGTASVDKVASNNFQLTLRIKKVTKGTQVAEGNDQHQ